MLLKYDKHTWYFHRSHICLWEEPPPLTVTMALDYLLYWNWFFFSPWISTPCVQKALRTPGSYRSFIQTKCSFYTNTEKMQAASIYWGHTYYVPSTVHIIYIFLPVAPSQRRSCPQGSFGKVLRHFDCHSWDGERG